MRHALNAELFKDQNERGSIHRIAYARGRTPRNDSNNNQHRQHVEGRQANHHRLRRGTHRTRGILRLRSRDRDHLNTAEGEHHNSQRQPHRLGAVRHETAVVEEVRGTHRSVTGQTEENQAQAHQQEGNNRNDLNRRQEELQHAERLHAGQVQHNQRHTKRGNTRPQRKLRPPIIQVHRNRHQLNTGNQHSRRPVGDASQKAREGAQVAGSNSTETAADRVANRHFTGCRANHRSERRTNSVGENDRGTSHRNGGARTQEEARTERRTHHNHGHLSVGQRTLQGARSGGPRCSVAAGIVVVGHEGAFRQYALGA